VTALNDDDVTLLERTMMGVHDELDHGFFVHQQALLDRDLASAATRLEAYRELIARHMADEEGLILPRYAALGGDLTDAPVRLFLGEHAKMREFLADFAQRIAGLQEHPGDRALLELMDRQATYKNLMLHHDLRERRGLYPFLSARLAVADQGQLVAARHARIG